jgi:AcrR family transcriptional regulator
MSATETSEYRERLLDALASSIRERGLRGTQIADIVRIARTSRRTFYECFPDKESCFVELVREKTTQLLAEVESSVDPAAGWREQVDQAVDTYLDALGRDPALTVTLSRELPALGMRGALVQREGIERFAELMVRMVRSEPMRRAGTREIPLEAAVMLVGGVNELVVRAVDRGESLERVAPVAKDVVKSVLDAR